MGSTMTKENLIVHILRATNEVSESTLRTKCRMTDLWAIERALANERRRKEDGRETLPLD